MLDFPIGTPHDVIRAVDFLESSGYVVTRAPINGGYDPEADALGSYHDALAEIRGRHRVVVRALLPKLRQARGKLKMSTRKFAPHLGVSVSYLRKCEAGTEIPSPDLFSRWRTLLGL